MRVVTLLGSARKKGNTATVLGWVEDGIRSGGHAVERIALDGRSINGCLGCARCREHPDGIACVQQDDAVAIMERMVAADGVLFASPVYFWGFSAQIKLLIDRTYALATHYHQPGHTSLMAGKRVGLLVTGAGPYEGNAEGLFTAFDRIAGYYLAHQAGTLYVGDCSGPDELPGTARGEALELARALCA